MDLYVVLHGTKYEGETITGIFDSKEQATEFKKVFKKRLQKINHWQSDSYLKISPYKLNKGK